MTTAVAQAGATPAASSWTPTILASARDAGLTGESWALEIRERPDRELGKALTHLAERCSGASIFFEPPFLNASWHRFGGAPKRLMVLLDETGETAVPRLAFPFSEAGVGLPRQRVWKAFSHPFAPLSLPLMERGRADELGDRFAGLLMQIRPERPLVFEDFPPDEPEARELVRALEASGFAVRWTAERRRAALLPQPERASGPRNGAKRARELRRGLRKLEELGKVEFEIATGFWDVLVRYEEFLLLETRSWKGRKGSSIHIVRKTAAFARQAVGALAKQGRAAILSLRLDGRAIASLVVLTSGRRFYPWKTAFDEAYRSHAPGMQLMARASEHFLAADGFEFADSLAKTDSWVDRLWPDRVRLATLVVAQSAREADGVAAALERHDYLKERVKRLIRR